VGRVVWLIGFVALVVTTAGCSTSEVGRSDLPIESDFSDCDEWSTDEDDNVSLSCDSGQYRVLYKDTTKQISHIIPRRSHDPVEGVGVQADVAFNTVPGTNNQRFVAAGVGCWVSGVNEPLRGYYFALSPDRAIAILKVDETDMTLKKQFFSGRWLIRIHQPSKDPARRIMSARSAVPAQRRASPT
jgi:hypothetical protein